MVIPTFLHLMDTTLKWPSYSLWSSTHSYSCKFLINSTLESLRRENSTHSLESFKTFHLSVSSSWPLLSNWRWLNSEERWLSAGLSICNRTWFVFSLVSWNFHGESSSNSFHSDSSTAFHLKTKTKMEKEKARSILVRQSRIRKRRLNKHDP